MDHSREVLKNLTAADNRSSSLQYSTVFEFEKNFDVFEHHAWLERNFNLIYVYSILYLCVVFGGQSFMKNKKGLSLRPLLATWNSALAVFSILGTIRTFPEMIYVLNEFGFTYSVCNNSFATANRVTAFWGWKFGTSKLWELADTVFIVLRKRELIFLHWYHHLSVLLFCGFGGIELIAPGRWYMVMNYFVHSFMYTYFALRAMNIDVPKKIAMCITTLQISQMVMGCFVSWWAYSVKTAGESCHISKGLVSAVLAIYISFFLLFSKVFYDSYLSPSCRKRKSKENK